MESRTKKSKNAIAEKERALRDTIWPDLDESKLWDRKKTKGYTAIPRTMPLIIQILSEMSNGLQLGTTYLDLWCKAWSDSFVRTENPKTRAFYAGYSGQRGADAWNTRIKRLEDLGFIETSEGTTGPYHYVLIKDPHQVIDLHYKKGKSGISKASDNALHERLKEIKGE